MGEELVMPPHENLPDPTSAEPPLAGDDTRALRENMLLTATIEELRARAERLHAATDDLAAQNEQLRAAREALEDERARYRELFALAPDAFVLTDANGWVVEANDRAAAFLGVRGDSLVGRSLSDFLEPPSRPAFRGELLALSESGGRRGTELRFTPREGPTLDVDATVAAVAPRSDGGALLWLLRDVSERVGVTRALGERLTERTDELERAHERAELERRHLRDLLHRLQEGVVAVAADGQVVYANGPASDLFLPARLVEGEQLPDPWPGVSLPSLVRSLFAPQPTLRDVHVTTDTGRVLSIRGIPALGSQTAGLVISDVSTRDRRERAEREFVTNAAHELRTPLAAITGAIEALQRGAKEEPAARDRFLTHVGREAERLTRLSTALLTLARAEMGVEEPRLEVVRVRRLLEHVATETRPAGGVDVEVSCPDDLAVFASPALLEQALGNLASNAAKHTSRGTIELRGSRESELWVSIEVADTGSGIRSEELGRVSERFQRSGSEEGFGLGLAIATQSARALGGRLELDSEPGRGTTARIVLPSAEVVTSE
jgi:PAS domain S-box-containing protein